MEIDTLSVLVTGEFTDPFGLSVMVEHMELLGVRVVERPEDDTLITILGNQSGYHPADLRGSGRLVIFERDLPSFRERYWAAVTQFMARCDDETLDSTDS